LLLLHHDRIKEPPSIARATMGHPPKTPNLPRALLRVGITLKERPRASQ
jgi:hypothetical protein